MIVGLNIDFQKRTEDNRLEEALRTGAHAKRIEIKKEGGLARKRRPPFASACSAYFTETPIRTLQSPLLCATIVPL